MKNSFENSGSSHMDYLMEKAAVIRESLPPVPDGHIRLWRGNRPDEVGHNPSYTNSLEGIALPFLEGYEGVLSYVDIPEEDSKKYLRTGAVAEGSEFSLPPEVVRNVRIVGLTSEQSEDVKSKAKPKQDVGPTSFDSPVE